MRPTVGIPSSTVKTGPRTPAFLQRGAAHLGKIGCPWLRKRKGKLVCALTRIPPAGTQGYSVVLGPLEHSEHMPLEGAAYQSPHSYSPWADVKAGKFTLPPFLCPHFPSITLHPTLPPRRHRPFKLGANLRCHLPHSLPKQRLAQHPTRPAAKCTKEDTGRKKGTPWVVHSEWHSASLVSASQELQLRTLGFTHLSPASKLPF